MTGNKAMYQCKCGERRQYGHVEPDSTYRPKLNCAKCKKVVPHKFVEVERVN
jgi:hypothetical protein